MFQSKVGQKPGVYSPVTGHAIVVTTTCVDDSHVDDLKRLFKGGAPGNRYSLPNKDLPRRVESHLLALKKRNGRSKYRKGSGADLKIITMINGLEQNTEGDWQHVGIVQTPINPDDGTKPQGFRTNATRIGGTVSMINTGIKTIPPNSCICWSFPTKAAADKGIDGQKIKGHPEGAIYPLIEVYDIVDVAQECADKRGDVKKIREILARQERIIGWSLNQADPGCQLDVILKR